MKIERSHPTHIVIGGGAAGFFGALACAAKAPHARVIIVEKTRQLLTKVRISGGGRCNVTHHCFDPSELVKNYPRGQRELRGPFARFQPTDTIAWFESRGVRLKTEEDGRMFPDTDQSETIIHCLLSEAKRLGVEIRTESNVKELRPLNGGFELLLANGEALNSNTVLLATGGTRHGFDLAELLGHTIVPPVPSLFTFNVPDSLLHDLAGTCVDPAELTIQGTKLRQQGPLLLTHWGFSGPAVLKLSAWGARILHDMKYQATLAVRWLAGHSLDSIEAALREAKAGQGARTIHGHSPFEVIPRKLWQRLLTSVEIAPETRWAQLGKDALTALAAKLANDTYAIDGKTTYKQEFVTCGGVALEEVNFTTMESRRCPGLFFAGEVLNIDGVTGGFNFQAAWTTGWLSGEAMGSR